MKTGVIAFSLCYLTLPVALYCGFALLSGQLLGIIPLLYYVLLTFALVRCSRLPSPARYLYRLALGIVGAHLICLAVCLLRFESLHGNRVKDLALSGLLLSIAGVYVVSCLAGAVLAWGRGLKGHAALQLLGPAYLSSCYFLPGPLSNSSAGSVLAILAFFGQGLHAGWLSLGLLNTDVPAPTSDIGLNPA